MLPQPVSSSSVSLVLQGWRPLDSEMFSRGSALPKLVQCASRPNQGALTIMRRPASTSASKQTTKTEPEGKAPTSTVKGESSAKPIKKTMAQIDEEMRLAMEGMSGDGGESGMELEDGKPVSMKRGVRENMFRYI